MRLKLQKVQVATTITVDPLPGILIRTPDGDVIIVLEIMTRQLGIHAPDRMTMNEVNNIVNAVSLQAQADEEFPFTATDEDPMVMEEAFIWADLSG